jgi:large subunit ribosomal protein L29
MRANELREMNPQERAEKLEDLVEEYRGLRFGHVMQQVSNPMRLREVRRDIARLRTIIAEEARKTQETGAVATGGEEV